MQIQHGANLNDAGSVQIGHRLEATDTPFENQAHQEGFHCVIIVVAQRQLVEAPVQNGLIQRAPAHFGAHGARIFLLPVVKNDRRDFGFYNGIGNLQPVAQGLDAGIIHSQSHVYGDGLQFIGFVKIQLQSCQQHQQHQRVLPAGNAHGYFISLTNHIIIVHATANQAHQLLHCSISSQ